MQTQSAGSWQTQALPSDTFDDGESGWGGVTFDESGDTLVAVRGYQRIITTYDVKVRNSGVECRGQGGMRK
jgi:hypothetical protein